MPSAFPELRLGLIGYGYAGKTFHAPLIRATPGLELAAVARAMPPRCMRTCCTFACTPRPPH